MLSTGEIRSLTGLRGAAACLVMVYHLSILDFKDPHAGAFINHGYLAVDFFLVLSGFVLGLRYFNAIETGRCTFFDFFVHRLIRIWPLYALCVSLYIIVAFINGTFILSRPVPVEIISNYLMIQSWGGVSPSIIPPSWSISAEWLASLFFPILIIAFLRSGWRVAISGFLVTLGLLCVVAAFKSQRHDYAPSELLNTTNWRSPAPMVRCLTEFCFGLFAYRIAARCPRLMHYLRNSCMGLSISVFTVVSIILPRMDIFTVLLFTTLILHLSFDCGIVAYLFKSRIAYIVGSWSYALYLIHFCFRPIKTMLERYLKDLAYGYEQIFSVIILGCLSLICAAVIHTLFDRPIQLHLRRRFDKFRKEQRDLRAVKSDQLSRISSELL